MKIDESQYWALVQYIDNTEDEVVGFQIEEFDEEDFPEWCRILRRLNGDICGQATLQFFLCPDCSQLHGLIEVIKE